MNLVSNGGSLTTNKQCVVKNLNQPVWFHKDYITNFLSLGILKKLYRITYDSQKSDGSFIVNRNNKKPLYFNYHPSNLHFLDTTVKDISMVQTVKDNMRNFTKYILDILIDIDNYI